MILYYNPDRSLPEPYSDELRILIRRKHERSVRPVTTHRERKSRWLAIRRCNEAMQPWVGALAGDLLGATAVCRVARAVQPGRPQPRLFVCFAFGREAETKFCGGCVVELSDGRRSANSGPGTRESRVSLRPLPAPVAGIPALRSGLFGSRPVSLERIMIAGIRV